MTKAGGGERFGYVRGEGIGGGGSRTSGKKFQGNKRGRTVNVKSRLVPLRGVSATTTHSKGMGGRVEVEA